MEAQTGFTKSSLWRHKQHWQSNKKQGDMMETNGHTQIVTGDKAWSESDKQTLLALTREHKDFPTIVLAFNTTPGICRLRSVNALWWKCKDLGAFSTWDADAVKTAKYYVDHERNKIARKTFTQKRWSADEVTQLREFLTTVGSITDREAARRYKKRFDSSRTIGSITSKVSKMRAFDLRPATNQENTSIVGEAHADVISALTTIKQNESTAAFRKGQTRMRDLIVKYCRDTGLFELGGAIARMPIVDSDK
jgi:hypothetical protein